MQAPKALLLSVCFACAYPNLARAQTPAQTNATVSVAEGALVHCLAKNPDNTCKVAFAPDVLQGLAGLNIKTGQAFFGPTSLGGCYGITYQPDQWYATGFDLCFNWQLSQSSPNLLWPSGAIHVLKYGAVDIGPQCHIGSGDRYCQWNVLWSANLPITM